MRTLIALAALAAGALPAAAADTPLTADQIRDIARKDMVWCENYRAASKDCESLVMVSLMPDGSLRETGLLRLSDKPDLQLVMDGKSTITGDKVCSVFGDETVTMSFVLNGRQLPVSSAPSLEAIVKEAMSEFEGKTLCQTFYRGQSEADLREVVTLDGERREDLESVYRLQADEAGLNLRATPGTDGEESMI